MLDFDSVVVLAGVVVRSARIERFHVAVVSAVGAVVTGRPCVLVDVSVVVVVVGVVARSTRVLENPIVVAPIDAAPTCIHARIGLCRPYAFGLPTPIQLYEWIDRHCRIQHNHGHCVRWHWRYVSGITYKRSGE